MRVGRIYESAGYSQRDAAKSILEHNIYGLDIDDRAYQLAYFAVMMKARQYNRRILNGENTCHVYAIQESNSINRAHLKYFGAGMDDIEKNAAKMQMEGLLDTLTDAKEYGSILNVESYNWDLLRRFVAAEDTDGQISMDSVGVEDTAEQLNRLIDIGETMAQKYWVTCTNPPYAGMSKMNADLNIFVQDNYADYKSDMFSVFVVKASHMTLKNGFCAFLTPYVWMFIQSYEKMRQYLYKTTTIETLIQFEYSAFEEATVPICTFVFRNGYLQKKGCYLRLVDFRGGMEVQKKKTLEAISNHECGYYYEQSAEIFEKIPNAPVAYWVSPKVGDAYKNSLVKKYMNCKSGIMTGDDSYIRIWNEVSTNKIKLDCRSANDMGEYRWFPLNSGGDFRYYYGNNNKIVNLWHDGADIVANVKNYRLRDKQYYFKKGITWGRITSSKIAFREVVDGSLFGDAGPIGFIEKHRRYLLGFLCTKVALHFLEATNPTLNYQVRDIENLPLLIDNNVHDLVESIVGDAISVEKQDWDAFEASWDFKKHPLLRNVSTISEAFNQWQTECDDRFSKLRANEEELNRIFIDIYGLQDELTPEVEDKDVTVRKADLQRDIKSLLSYAVGCMFGRYSLDVEGLAYAGGEWDSSKYQNYIPDADNVIPITDEEYLDDDIVSRLCAWLKAVYGADTLEVNLDYIAKALGNKGGTSREIIRNYFLNDFFKDHCQTYSVTGSGKRPIYWLFDSGKQNGFKALVYLHRYTPDTIGNLRIDYLHKMQRVYESEINRMQDMMDHSGNAREVAAASKRKDKLAKQLKECREYDEKISHLALSRIELDLDDGVKVNYRKLQTAQDGKFYEVLADSKNIMVKEKK